MQVYLYKLNSINLPYFYLVPYTLFKVYLLYLLNRIIELIIRTRLITTDFNN